MTTSAVPASAVIGAQYASAHGAPVISLRNVGLRYGLMRSGFRKKHKEFWALKDVSFDLYHGENLGIVGSNGAGKSTLLRILSGILAPDRGTVTRDESLHCQLLSVGVGFESSLTGRENAILGGMLLGKTKKYMMEHIEAIKEFSEIDEFFEQPLYTYSTGMVGRLGFAVAIHADPDILLLDELLGAGDAQFSNKATAEMKKIVKSNKTIVLTSHNPHSIIELCNRAVWIQKGVSMAEGDPVEVVTKYYESIGQPLPPKPDKIEAH